MSSTIKDLKEAPGWFNWGKIIKIHEVGRYAVVEFEPNIVNVYRDGRYVKEKEAQGFHVYVDGKDTNMGASTLEGAFLLAMAAGNVPKNDAPCAARCAAKILNVQE
jgi:hypothetical protein